MEVGGHGIIGGRREADTSVTRAFGIPDSVFGGTYVGGGGIACVLGKDGGDGGEVRASGI